VIARLAGRQDGVVSRRQLLGAGLSMRAIEHRIVTGHLHRVHLGVYAAGHPRLSPRGRLWAAVLAGGPGAVLSHRSAAAVWGLRPDNRPVVEIISPRRLRHRPGITTHQAALEAADRTSHDGLPVTAWPRTLLDLATQIPTRDLHRAVERADRHELLDLTALDELFRRATHHRGTGKLKRATASYDPRHHRTRSELERRALEILDRHGLPRPELNARVAGLEVDLVWRAHQLVVELDGWEHHRTRGAFERDRRRALTLATAGYTCLPVTWRQLVDDERRTVAALRTRLS
jgi:very-short-patch-repair endonuclease